MTLNNTWRSFSLGCHFHVHFSNHWHAFASHGLPAIAELLVDLGPITPKICTKSPISRLVWHIDRRCLGLPGGFRGWPIQWNHAKCCGADPVARRSRHISVCFSLFVCLSTCLVFLCSLSSCGPIQLNVCYVYITLTDRICVRTKLRTVVSRDKNKRVHTGALNLQDLENDRPNRSSGYGKR